MLNRAAVILKLKEPFIKWMNEADPYDNPWIELESANEDCTVYLISSYDAEMFDEWMSLNYLILFENELEDWYSDKSLWPKHLDRELFDEWFKVELHTVLYDTADDKIEDDGI